MRTPDPMTLQELLPPEVAGRPSGAALLLGVLLHWRWEHKREPKRPETEPKCQRPGVVAPSLPAARLRALAPLGGLLEPRQLCCSDVRLLLTPSLQRPAKATSPRRRNNLHEIHRRSSRMTETQKTHAS